jgi:hypothetical protein
MRKLVAAAFSTHASGAVAALLADANLGPPPRTGESSPLDTNQLRRT